jgi:hypothetical protein
MIRIMMVPFLCISIYTHATPYGGTFHNWKLSSDQLQLCEYIERYQKSHDKNEQLYISLTSAQEKIVKTLPCSLTQEPLFQDIMFKCHPSVLETIYYIGKDLIEHRDCIFMFALYSPLLPLIMPGIIYLGTHLYTTHKSIDMIIKK